MKRRKWSDEDVLMWAEIFVSDKRITLMKMEEMFGISHSTFWWCFTHRLPEIDTGLYNKVVVELFNHKRGKRSWRVLKRK